MNAGSLRWRGHLVAALLLAALAHLATVWALPRLIMDRIITLADGEARAQGAGTGAYLPPPSDHTQRRIVMPSPDLLYATCAFDLGERSLRVQFATDYERYWSIALYASNSDNFFVINDRAAAGKVDLLLQKGGAAVERANPVPTGSQVVDAPGTRGLLLLRMLVNDDPSVRAAAEAARGQLRCLPQ